MSVVDINGTSIEFPDNLTPDELQKAVAAAAQQINSQRQGVSQPQEKSMLGKAWDALTVPEKVAKKVLDSRLSLVPKPEPTGNLPVDIALGTPRVLAETGSKFLPTLINRPSLVTMGLLGGAGLLGKAAMSPMGRAIGGKIAQGAESLSGLEYKNPGVLKEAAKDSKLFLAEGKDAAGPIYEAAEAGKSKGPFEGMYKPDQIIDKVKDIFKEGSERFLTPEQAHMARKAIDKALSSGAYVKDELIGFRDKLDKIAKMSEGIKKGDAAFSRGIKAEALRTVFPVNKGGGTSIFKTGIGYLSNAGRLPLLPLMSPMAQGATATALGASARAASNLGAKAIPYGATIGAALSRRKK